MPHRPRKPEIPPALWAAGGLEVVLLYCTKEPLIPLGRGLPLPLPCDGKPIQALSLFVVGVLRFLCVQVARGKDNDTVAVKKEEATNLRPRGGLWRVKGSNMRHWVHLGR